MTFEDTVRDSLNDALALPGRIDIDPAAGELIRSAALRHRRTRRLTLMSGVGVVLAVVAGLIVWTTGSHGSSGQPVMPATPAPVTSPTVLPGPSAGPSTPSGLSASNTPGTGAGIAASASNTPGTGTGIAAGSAQNLVAPESLRPELLASFAAAKKTAVSEFAGPLAGTLYYAYVPASRTYWALANFEPSTDASFQTKVNLQDGGNTGVFTRQAGQPWQVRFGGIPFPCPGALPAAVLTLWGLTDSPGCITASANAPDRWSAPISTDPASIPAGTYFGVVLGFQLQLNGDGMLLFEPETWQGAGPPVNQRQGWFPLTLTPSTTTRYWTGSDRAHNHAVVGSFDATYAQVVSSAMVPFSNQPSAGYVITVSDSHVDNVDQIGAVAPLPAHPNFTEPQP